MKTHALSVGYPPSQGPLQRGWEAWPARIPKDRLSGQRSQQNGHVWAWIARAATKHYVLPFPQGEKRAPQTTGQSQIHHSWATRQVGPGLNLIYILRQVTRAKQHCLLNDDQPPKCRKIFLGSAVIKYTPLESPSPPLSPPQLTGWWVMGVTKGPLPLGEPQVCPFGCLVPCSANQPNLNTTIAFPTASRGSLSCLVSRVAARPWRTLCMSVHIQGLSVRHPGLGCKHSSLMGLLLPPSHPRSAGDSRPVRVRETLPSDQGLIGATVSEIRYLMQSKEIKQRFKLNSPPSRRRNEVMPSPTTQ